jgi:hypothetical protein
VAFSLKTIFPGLGINQWPGQKLRTLKGVRKQKVAEPQNSLAAQNNFPLFL